MSRRRKILIAIVVVLGVAVIIPYLHHCRLRAAVNAYIIELKAKGEPLELKQVLPPPVRPEQNSAAIFQHAVSLLSTDQNLLERNPPPAMRMIAPGKAMIGWMQPRVRSTEGTNSWGEIESALVGEDEALQLLRKIIDQPAFDFQLDYKKGLILLLPHLAPMKKCAKRLSAATVFDLHHNDTASATTNVLAMLALVKGLRDEPILISQLVRIAIAHIAWSANWELLQSAKVTDKQLTALRRAWSDLEFIRAEESAMLMERAIAEMTIADLKKSGAAYRDFRSGLVYSRAKGLDWFQSLGKTTVELTMWRFSWSFTDELQALKIYQVQLNAVRLVQTNHSFYLALQQQESALRKIDPARKEELGHKIDVDDIDMRRIFSDGALSTAKSLQRVLTVEVEQRLAVTAMALKQYQMRLGTYPPELIALVPEFIPIVPLDPVDGQPLRYRLNANRTFLLYAIGEDGKDDGGDPRSPGDPKSRAWQRGRDWVWPQPATAEEIKADEERMAAVHGLSAEEKFRSRYGLPATKNGNTNKAN